MEITQYERSIKEAESLGDLYAILPNIIKGVLHIGEVEDAVQALKSVAGRANEITMILPSADTKIDPLNKLQFHCNELADTISEKSQGKEVYPLEGSEPFFAQDSVDSTKSTILLSNMKDNMGERVSEGYKGRNPGSQVVRGFHAVAKRSITLAKTNPGKAGDCYTIARECFTNAVDRFFSLQS